MDRAIQQAQKKIEYISYNEEDYRQIILREQALLDYQSDLNAYKREGRQEIIDAMRESGISEEVIEKVLKLREEQEEKNKKSTRKNTENLYNQKE